MAEEVKAALRKNSEPRRQAYLEDVCAVCHQQTLVASGLKVSCECGFNGDRFQDGDKAA
jgi:hypothetical protein